MHWIFIAMIWLGGFFIGNSFPPIFQEKFEMGDPCIAFDPLPWVFLGLSIGIAIGYAVSLLHPRT